jgi:hypothetical protein
MLPSNASEWETVSPPPNKSGPRVGGVVVTIVLALALVAIIAFGVSRLSTGGFTRPSAATSPTRAAASAAQSAAAAGTPADAATEQVIQQIIQQVDQAQIQAIQSNDPSAMATTATPEFYQEQVVNNQDLLASGVTEIKLVSMEWGPITVSGNTASATVWETWSTTFDDGTTQQSRDRNVYTLVLDNGTWKVQADDHPDQAAASSTPGPGSAPAP